MLKHPCNCLIKLLKQADYKYDRLFVHSMCFKLSIKLFKILKDLARSCAVFALILGPPENQTIGSAFIRAIP